MRCVKRVDDKAICKVDANEKFAWGVDDYVIVDCFYEKKANIANLITTCRTLEEAEEEVERLL